MKEINSQLYGYSYELDKTTEDDLTTCYAIDTGTIFVAFGGVWYEQPGSRWAAGGGSGGGSGGGGVTIVNITEDNHVYTMDKTWGEIDEAFQSGAVVAVLELQTPGIGDETHKISVVSVSQDAEQYYVNLTQRAGLILGTFLASTEDDYPVFDDT